MTAPLKIDAPPRRSPRRSRRPTDGPAAAVAPELTSIPRALGDEGAEPLPAEPILTALAAALAPLSTTSPATASIIHQPTAAVAAAAELDALGVRDFFLMTGRDNTLWIALQAAGIRQILARTEAAAVYMADGYARVTGRPTFVYGAYGPGAANVAGALAEPFWSSSPVVAMASAMRRTERHRAEYQELDQPKMFEPVTKWAVEAADAKQLPRLIREAARRSVAGSPGPVYLGVPGDIYEELLPDHVAPPRREPPLEVPLARPAPSRAEAALAVLALATAVRPVILAGSGVHQSGAWLELTELAERLGVPVVTSVGGKGAIAEVHPLALGTVGRYSRNYANAALREADVVLAIGTRLGGMVTDSYRLLGPATRLFHVTVEPEALGQNFPTELGVVADARAFLAAALETMAGHDDLALQHDRSSNGHDNGTTRSHPLPRRSPVRERYLDGLAERKAAWRRRRDELAVSGADGALRPEAVMAAIDELMPDDAIVCADTGYASAWPGGLLELRQPGRSFFRADGTLGWSFAGALGAQLAAPERRVISIIGDGGFGYQVAELETAVRLGLPVVTIILNNRTLAFESHVQTLLYDHLVPEVDDFVDVDYAAVARAFQAEGTRVANVADLRRALGTALERREPTVIDAVIDPDAIAPVTRYDRVRTREL